MPTVDQMSSHRGIGRASPSCECARGAGRARVCGSASGSSDRAASSPSACWRRGRRRMRGSGWQCREPGAAWWVMWPQPVCRCVVGVYGCASVYGAPSGRRRRRRRGEVSSDRGRPCLAVAQKDEKVRFGNNRMADFPRCEVSPESEEGSTSTSGLARARCGFPRPWRLMATLLGVRVRGARVGQVLRYCSAGLCFPQAGETWKYRCISRA